jgi:intein/homing endonuclease
MNNTGRQSAGKTLAWLAGFLEGDGSFTLSKWNRKNGKFIISPKVSCTNTDHTLIEEIHKVLKQFKIGHYISSKNTINGTAKTINIKGFKRVAKFLPIIIPYLRGKKKIQAQLMLIWIFSRKLTGNNNTYTENELKIYEEVSKLKKPD